MNLHPFEKISHIYTGNIYKGTQGYVDICAGEKFLEVARDFHNHNVFAKSDDFPTSIISNNSVHVYYNAEGKVIGAEIFTNLNGNNEFNFIWNSFDLFQSTMKDVANGLKSIGIKTSIEDYGIFVPELGLNYYCNDIQDDLDCKIDCVYVTLNKNN
ncbi:hypothetical protein G3A56_23335 [Rhizobium oryzihabitans]|uniref:Uncharacterized protein n=1 Tax=Rhizobium oryzihabitans TaxID=2267833 RepID=A0A7L5BPB1_9HYPH|nr:hypothetical protein [Rhizobium oryzihabitans]QCM07770.1 hypothetical protein CFBP6626_20960 [Agrobacterium tumefaciens]QIB40752.1 hypothetical protein G3A56_23335 [Rhizobium oryzihabitans]